MLDKLLQEEPAWQYKYEMLARHWQAASQQEDDGSAATRYLELWQEMGARNINTLHAAPEAPRRRQYTRWLAAAAFMGLLATTGMYFLRRDKTTAATSEVATASGSRSKMLLPDGTQVWLNAGSRIVYNNLRFNSSNREVQLDGEALHGRQAAEADGDVIRDQERLARGGLTCRYATGLLPEVPELPAPQQTLRAQEHHKDQDQ